MKNKLFTLIELIVVIVVISILVAIVIPNIADIRERAVISALDSDARNIELAVDKYALDKNEAVPTQDGTPVDKETTSLLKLSLHDEGEVELLAEEVNVTKLVKENYLKKGPKHKQAKFYLVEGGDVIWVYEGLSSNPSIKEDNSPKTNESHNVVEGDKENEEIDGQPSITRYPYEHMEGIEIVQQNPSDFLYEIHGDEVTIIGYKGASGKVIIPYELEGKRVTAIGDTAFYSKGITEVIIPNTMVSLGGSSFYSNSLSHLELPDSIEFIGGTAFGRNKLVKVILPNSVETIGDYAFSFNQITTVKLSNSLKTISSGAFASNKITEVIIPNSVTTIGEKAFWTNNIKSLDIPNSVEIIGPAAFYSNNLTSLSIPNSVTRVEDSAFEMNEINMLELPDSLVYIGNLAFYTNKLTTVKIPNSVTYIGDIAFAKNTITHVEIPASVTSGGNYVFHENPKLKTVTTYSKLDISNWFQAKTGVVITKK